MRCSVILWVFLVLGGALAADASGVLPGDFNNDGVVNTDDLQLILDNYDHTGMTPEQGDANGDTTVDMADMDVLLTHFNHTAAAGGPAMANLPEPSSMALLAVAALGVSAFLRRKWK